MFGQSTTTHQTKILVGETKSNGGAVGNTQLEPALHGQLRATKKKKNPVVVGVTTMKPQLNDPGYR